MHSALIHCNNGIIFGGAKRVNAVQKHTDLYAFGKIATEIVHTQDATGVRFKKFKSQVCFGSLKHYAWKMNSFNKISIIIKENFCKNVVFAKH